VNEYAWTRMELVAFWSSATIAWVQPPSGEKWTEMGWAGGVDWDVDAGRDVLDGRGVAKVGVERERRKIRVRVMRVMGIASSVDMSGRIVKIL